MKLAPVLPNGEDVFPLENSASDIKVGLNLNILYSLSKNPDSC